MMLQNAGRLLQFCPKMTENTFQIWKREGRAPSPPERRTLTDNKPVFRDLTKLAFHISDTGWMVEGNTILFLVKSSKQITDRHKLLTFHNTVTSLPSHSFPVQSVYCLKRELRSLTPPVLWKHPEQRGMGNWLPKKLYVPATGARV